MVDVLFFEKSG